MRKFKELLATITDLFESEKAGVAQYQAIRRDSEIVRNPFPNGDYFSTYGKVTGQQASQELGLKSIADAKAINRAIGKAKGEKQAEHAAQMAARLSATTTAARSSGIPDIENILKGKLVKFKNKHGKTSTKLVDVAGVTVVGLKKDGYIARHQGVLHFKHPNGKTHAGVRLMPSHQGIGIWPSNTGKRSNKPIAHIHPQGNAVGVTGMVKGGNIEIDRNDDLNR